MRIVHTFFDYVLGPLSGLTPAAAMVVICAVVGLISARIFGLATNQRKVRRAADLATAELLAVKLFRHDPLAVVRAELRLCRAIGRRLWLTLPAVLILAAPLILLLVALAPRFEHRAILPGEAVTVEVRDPSLGANIRDAHDLTVDTPALRDPIRQTVSWRVRPSSILASLVIAHRIGVPPTSFGFDVNERAGATFHTPYLPPDVRIHYPASRFQIAGVFMPWWLAFFLGTMLFAWCFGKALGVRF